MKTEQDEGKSYTREEESWQHNEGWATGLGKWPDDEIFFFPSFIYQYLPCSVVCQQDGRQEEK